MGSITRVLSRITIVITHIRRLIASLITTHGPPSSIIRVRVAIRV